MLAAGSLESPRIALRSSLPDRNRKIGRGLTDHPAFFSREYRLPPGSEFGGLADHAKILMSHRQASLAAHGYNVEILINPKHWMSAIPTTTSASSGWTRSRPRVCGCSSSSPAIWTTTTP